VHRSAEVIRGEQVNPAVADNRGSGGDVHRFVVRHRASISALVPSAAWARSKRWARSASSSWRARAIASRMVADAPASAPRSSLA
jgi:hypothetical protein